MWIKICGNSLLEDVLEAHRLGADAVGFIFAHGKRLVTAEHVSAIASSLPPSLETFGVFTQTDASYILKTAEAAGIGGLQLHGDFQPALARALRPSYPKSLLQVVPWWTDRPAASQREAFRRTVNAIAESGLVDAVLLDSRTQNASGGTGVAFDWDAVALELEGVSLRVVVAGGLRPETVAEAIAVLKPWGVDVSSGVEATPGVKDHAKVAAFVLATRG